MELSTGQQRAIFAVVVVCLAGLGLYLVVPALHHKSGASASTRPSASAPASPAPATSAPATVSPSAPAPGSVNIYNWLPFTQQDLAEAASVTLSFCSAYESYNYTESAAAYAARLSGVATSGLVQELKNAYATPGVAQARTGQKQVSSGSGTIDSLRAYGATSLTFVVTIGQKVISTKGSATNSTQYAITVESAAGGWQVNDIELSTQGQF